MGALTRLPQYCRRVYDWTVSHRVHTGGINMVSEHRTRATIPALLALAALCPISLAQTKPQTQINVKSNLVSVPTFVFYDAERITPLSLKQAECFQAASNAFAALLPSQPYEPTDCGVAEIEGLTVQDFRLFQDDVEQKILSVIPEGWQSAVRDNMTWHNATSDTPSGIWSSTDLRADDLRIKFWPQMYSHFYNLVYAPPSSESGCHRITVSVNHQDVQVFARDQYCGGQSPSDVLAETKQGGELQLYLESRKRGKIPISLQAGAFQVRPQTARVHVSVWFPWKHLNHSWNDYHLLARIGVLGEVYTADGKLAARFSDLLYPSYWPTFVGGTGGFETSSLPAEQWSPAWLPTRYETQMDLPPGIYQVKVAVSDDHHLGRAETPLTIQAADSKRLGLSSVILCKRFRDAHAAAVEAAMANFAPQYVSLVSEDMQFTPAGDTTFRKREPLIAYFEVYEPLLATHPDTKVQARVTVIDAKTETIIKNFDPVDVASYVHAGNSTIPVAHKIPVDNVPPGTYRIKVEATDSAGRTAACRSAQFIIDLTANH